MRKPSRNRRNRRPPEPKNEKLERLKEIALSVGLEVREERLKREVGYSVRGGLCRVDEAEVVILDKLSEPTARIEVLCNVLAARDLGSVFIEPELRRLIGGLAMDGDNLPEGVEESPPVAELPEGGDETGPV